MSGAVKDPLRALQGARSRAQGGQLEERIEASCTRLAEAGRADISKTPEPMRPVSQPNKTGQFRAVYTKKAEPDFKGVMLGGRAVMFEAKSTGTGRLNKDRVLPEQAKKLDSYEALGAHCFIVATFDGLRMYRIPWTVWRSMKQRYGRSYVTEPDLKEYAVRFGPGFTPDLLRDIPTMDDIDQLSCASDVLTAFCGMSYGTKPETDEWRAAVCRLSRLMNWTTPERFMLVNEIRREQPNMEKPIFSFMGVPITEDSAGKLAEAMKKSGVSLGIEFLRILQDEIVRRNVLDYRLLLHSFQKGDGENVWTLDENGLTLEVGTNVEYAKFVNDGHWTNPKGIERRFVPGHWEKANGKDHFIYTPGEKTGMVLKMKWVEGSHYWESSVRILEKLYPELLEKKLQSWLDEYFKDFL